MDKSITELSHIHFVGIKGVGVAALALCAQDLGINVTGSDIEEVFITDKILKERGINWNKGFSENNIPEGADLVVTTGAHGGLKNPEVIAAKEKGKPILTHAEALAEFTREKELIAVCGVGGKTTTSAMIAYILEELGEKPSYAVGVSEIFGLGYGGRYSKNGKHFVAEADEYAVSPGVDNTPKFHLLSPKVAVVTNIKHDHPDVYPNLDDTLSAYEQFFMNVPDDGVIVVSTKDDLATKLAEKANGKVVFYEPGDVSSSLKLKIPGEYNLQNAAAAVAAVGVLGIERGKALKVLASFGGLKRRFEVVGKTPSGVTVVDDYAHHPSEIEGLIKAAREFFPNKKISIAFQPHTYSRTKSHFEEFAQALAAADKVFLIDIYASAREKRDEDVSSEKLAERTKSLNPEAFYIGGLNVAGAKLLENIAQDEVLLTVGAGDIFYLHKELVANYE